VHLTSVVDTKATAATLSVVEEGILRDHLRKADLLCVPRRMRRPPVPYLTLTTKPVGDLSIRASTDSSERRALA
jgi:hypothetical protein